MHLEGPCLSPAQTGAQSPDDLKIPAETDLTPLLAGLALLLFLFDVAQRRLDLFREPVKADKKEEAKPQADKEKKPQKPAKKKPESNGPSAADLLWQQMKDKKKL